MKEQWQELKETITEMRDNGGIGTQQEVCKFLANYMEILEKQMLQPCEDCISREEAIRVAEQGQIQGYEWQFKKLCTLPPAIQSNTGHWIDADDGYPFNAICSSCNRLNHLYGNYCKHCGAKMVKPQESEDEE